MTQKRTGDVPPMGWNSWNTFYDKYDAGLIMEMADTMVERGYLDCGYRYLVLDDCWLEMERDAQGKLVPSREKFPEGIGPVIDHVHRKGLKFGIYECCGVRTCAGYPGSFEHEMNDAATFASWGVDYLKYDNCHRPSSQGSELLYRRMSFALRSTGRDILLAACQWGTEEVGTWIRSTGAHTYRSTIDIRDRWDSISSITKERLDHLSDGGPGCFNDMDMLVVGMNGTGSNPETSAEGCTPDEYQTHFALWAMLNSPLMIGCDLRKADEGTRALLQNRDLIAINQDREGRTCYKLTCTCSPTAFTLVRPLSGGDYAVGIFNFGEKPCMAGLPFWDMGISAASAEGLHFHDCLTHKDMGVYKESFSAQIPGHGCRVYRVGAFTR